MKILKRLKKSINTILLFIRAFELALLLLKRKTKEQNHQKKKKPINSVMGISRTIIGDVTKKTYVKPVRLKEEIDYEAESVPLETVGVSFETLEKLDKIAVEGTIDEESKATIKSLEGTDLGYAIKEQISSLLDRVEYKESSKETLTDLSSYLD